MRLDKGSGRERGDVVGALETTVTRCDSTENKDMLTTPHQHWVLLATEPWPSQVLSSWRTMSRGGTSVPHRLLLRAASHAWEPRAHGALVLETVDATLLLIRTIVAQPNHPTRQLRSVTPSR